MEILSYDFMQRAFICGTITALFMSCIGVFIVLRRMSQVGDSLSHSALAGVAAGMLFGIYPFWGAIIFTVIAAVFIEIIRKSFKQYAEVALAVVMSGSMGLAGVLVSLSKSFSGSLMSYLFGSLIAISPVDVKFISIIGIFILLSVAFFRRELFSITFDEEAARISGIPVDFINFYFTILTALAVALSTRIVGALLVSALMVIPTAVGIISAKSFKQVFTISVFTSLISVILGLVISFIYDIAPGGTIVLISVGVLILAIIAKKSLIKVG